MHPRIGSKWKRTSIIFMLLLSCYFFLAGNNNEHQPYLKEYKEADAIYNNRESTEQDERVAVALFEKVIGRLGSTHQNDSLLFESYVKAGTLYIGLDGLQQAVRCFNAAIATGKAMNKPAHGIFQPHLYCGRSWYTLGQYDSALYHYQVAEKIADAEPAQPMDRERLFNMLGAVYYELGNYTQSVNYFTKAEKVLSLKNPDYTDLITRYKNNISASLLKLELFDSANAICDELIKQLPADHPLLPVAWHRKAAIHLSLEQPQQALAYLEKIPAYPDRGEINRLNDFAQAFLQLGRYDSSLVYLQESLAKNREYYPSGKNPGLAITYKLWGRMLEAQHHTGEALRQYHNSVLALASGFSDTSIYSNPTGYTGIFAANTLLESLTVKASAFEQWYHEDKNTLKLEAAVNTYRSVFELAAYMEKSYDTDEARLLLNKRKYAIHDNPIRLCVQLYHITGEKKYLEQAFYFDEQNKASVLNENLMLLRSRKTAGLPSALLAQEKSLKQKITALLLKAVQPADEATVNSIQSQVLDQEIELNKLYKKLAAYPAYVKMNEQDQNLSPLQVQQKLDGHTMALAFHLGENSITCFWFTQKEWNCFVTPLNDSFPKILQQQVSACRSPGAGNSRETAVYLFSKLLAPLGNKLQGITSLAIVPDDELHQLPFETLVNEKGETLATLYNFCYNYSCNLLFRSAPRPKPVRTATLAMAPFAHESTSNFAQLVHSAEEIEGLEGKKLLDREAGKAAFLQWLPGYRVVHLATHATAGNSNTAQSYVAFNGADSAARYLYREEIVNLDMDSVQLLYLSACETGYGRLVKGEGMMSLSRAFAYAGCPDVITSLWQADDAATAIITKSFYRYYFNGDDPPLSLQKAKKDYLEDPAIDNRKKTPFYWAHLVFVGQEAPPGKNRMARLPFITAGIVALVLGLLFFIQQQKSAARK